MFNLATKATLATMLGATALVATAAPAEAQRYRYRDRDRGDAALVAGIAGLAIGAAIASSDRRYDYDRRYYRHHGYYPYDGYYYRDYYRRYDSWEHCYTRRVYDPYIGRRVRVRYCR